MLVIFLYFSPSFSVPCQLCIWLRIVANEIPGGKRNLNMNIYTFIIYVMYSIKL